MGPKMAEVSPPVPQGQDISPLGRGRPRRGQSSGFGSILPRANWAEDRNMTGEDICDGAGGLANWQFGRLLLAEQVSCLTRLLRHS